MVRHTENNIGLLIEDKRFGYTTTNTLHSSDSMKTTSE